MEKENRIAVIGIIVNNRAETARRVNDILSSYGEIIVGRMGVPCKERSISVISVIADGNGDEIGALTGKLGNIGGIKVKVALMH